jgi:hypothetical protein
VTYFYYFFSLPTQQLSKDADLATNYSDARRGSVNEQDYRAYHEAPRDNMWFCEVPHCDSIFLPYILWGARHHCRICGFTVCGKHCIADCTINVTGLPIVQSLAKNDATNTTPIMASNEETGSLPKHLTCKWVCTLCTGIAAKISEACKLGEEQQVAALERAGFLGGKLFAEGKR